MSAVLTDVAGNKIELGDQVAYPTHDRSMRNQIVVGELVAVNHQRVLRTYWNYSERKRVTENVHVMKAKIKTNRRSYTSSYQSPYGGVTTTIEKVKNIVKVASKETV